MEKTIKYSIVYAVIRPEIGEKISVGVLVIEGDKLQVMYSNKKLEALKMLYSPQEYKVVARIVRNNLRQLDSVNTLMYLTRYSNNLIAFSDIQNIDNSHNDINSEWLYKNYVYSA